MPGVYRGKNGKLMQGSVGGSLTALAGVQSWDIEHSVDIEEVYSIGDTAKGKEFSFENWSGSFEVYASDGFAITPGTRYDVEFYPAGDGTAGLRYLAGTIMVESVSEPLAKDDVRQVITVNFQGDGALTRTVTP